MKNIDFPCKVTFHNKKLNKYVDVLIGFKEDCDNTVRLAKLDGYKVVKYETLREDDESNLS